MNILVFVIAMLMVLSLLTYGRVESFRNFSIIQSEFETYMQITARKGVNKLATERYFHTHIPAKYRDNKTPANSASSTLSFNLFIDKEERKLHPEQLVPFQNAAKNLMFTLYGTQPFFQKLEETRPQILDEILDGLIRASDAFTDKDKITRSKELATIDLGDESLNLAFTYMLHGQERNPPPKTEDQEGKEVPVTEHEGYPSLLDYITIKKNKLMIRVFLASKPLLLALFGNPDIVDQIMAIRSQFFNDVMKGKEIARVSEEFKNLFINQRLSYVPTTMLNFDVSKTNPSSYQ